MKKKYEYTTKEKYKSVNVLYYEALSNYLDKFKSFSIVSQGDFDSVSQRGHNPVIQDNQTGKMFRVYVLPNMRCRLSNGKIDTQLFRHRVSISEILDEKDHKLNS